jgi:hypothetical protein
MMGMRKLMQKMLVLTVIAALGISIIIGVSTAKPSTQKPLSISFTSPLPQTAYSQIDYQAKIAWTNPNSHVSYTGSLLFTVTSKSGKINTNDITLSYKGLTINPHQSGSTLQYYIPHQSFCAGKSGSFTVIITYNIGGSYNWQIGVVK